MRLGLLFQFYLGIFLWDILVLLWVNKMKPEVHFAYGELVSISDISFPPFQKHLGAMLNAGDRDTNEIAVPVQVW